MEELDSNITLKDLNNPLSAVASDTGEPVYKYSYHPKTGNILYSYPGLGHIDAIKRAGDESNFDDYVRIIYDHKTNIGGSRKWGAYGEDDESKYKSFEPQHQAFRTLQKVNPSLKWVFNLTQNDVTGDEREELNVGAIDSSRIMESFGVATLMRDFKKLLEGKI